MKLTVVTSLLYGLMFWTQTRFNLFVVISLFIFSIIAFFIIIKPKIGLFLLAFFSIISETHYLYGFELFESIYTYKVAGFSLIDYLIFLLLIRIVLFIALTGQHKFRTTFWDLAFLLITFLIIIASIYGQIFGASLRNWLVDIKMMLFLIVPFFASRFLLKDKNDILQFFEITFLTLLAKAIVYFFGYLIKFAFSGDLVIRVTLTSDVVFYPMLLLVLMAIYLTTEKIDYKNWALVAFLIVMLNIFWSFGRETWFWTLISMMLFMIFVEKKYRFKLTKTVFGAVLLSVLLISIIRPQTWKYAITTIKTFTLKTEGKGEEETGAVRIIEWINVHQLLVDTNTVLIGRGLGATWNDRYFPLPKKRDQYSFPINETDHVFTHMAFSKFYLKFGFLGSLIFWACLLLPWLKMLKFVKNLTLEKNQVLLAILLGSISIFAKLEIVRVALISGFIFGALSKVYLISKKDV